MKQVQDDDSNYICCQKPHSSQEQTLTAAMTKNQEMTKWQSKHTNSWST